MSLLTIIQNATDRIGLPRPSTVIGSGDNQVRILASLAQQEGITLARRHPWQVLRTEKVFTTIADITQAGALPADFDRFVEGSMYDRTQSRPVVGPITPQRWQELRAARALSVWTSFRINGNALLMYPVPPAGNTVAFEYVSKNWCGGAASTSPTQSAFMVDTDIAALDEELLTLGLVWRFLKARGLDYSEAFRSYEEEVINRMANDGGMVGLDLSPGVTGTGSFDPYISDGSWTRA